MYNGPRNHTEAKEFIEYIGWSYERRYKQYWVKSADGELLGYSISLAVATRRAMASEGIPFISR